MRIKLPANTTLTMIAISSWLILIVLSYLLLLRYEGTAATQDTTEVPLTLPKKFKISADNRNSFTLIMFAHPHCPCTIASINELKKIVSRTSQLDACLYMLDFSEFKIPVYKATSWQNASSIPGLHLFKDKSGRIAKQFAAVTSGYTLVYSPAGKLVFQGGITAARGHEGDNKGMLSVISIINQNSSPGICSPVFGCSLKDNKSPNQEILKCLR